MSILSGEEIKKEIESERITIEPFYPENIKDASIELLLGNEFGIFRERTQPLIPHDINSSHIEWMRVNNVYSLEPQRSVVGKTKEKISLPPDIAGWITARGRTTFLGLNIQISPV